MTCRNCNCNMFNNSKPTIVGWGDTWDKTGTELITYFDIEFPWKCPICGAEEIEEFTTIQY